MDFLTVGVLIATLVVFLAIGVPVGFALGLAGVAAILTVGPGFLVQIPLTITKSFSDVVLIAIPAVRAHGELLYKGKVGQHCSTPPMPGSGACAAAPACRPSSPSPSSPPSWARAWPRAHHRQDRDPGDGANGYSKRSHLRAHGRRRLPAAS